MNATVRPRRGRRRTVVLILVALLLAGGWYFRRPLFQGNFGVADPGRVYRSAQPNSHLTEWSRRYGIAAVVNLRGGSPADAFYREESRLVRENHLAYFEIPMSATARPRREELLDLIAALNACPYPVLIHCKQGADRTALAVAIYRMVRKGEAPREALSSFRLDHAHIPLFGPESLHQPIEEYDRWLAAMGKAHTPARFREWVATAYVEPRRRPRRDRGTAEAIAAGKSTSGASANR